ncbi:Fc receptor-like A, partial [Catharus ustulatus]|uniref:Fc receptor-like A n=1 Tax=Catharus ustulatus TaxID=91951 RepID=UPI0014076E1E
TVTESGTYTCESPGTGLSPHLTVSDDWLLLQVLVWALLERDTVTLRCRVCVHNLVTSVSFYCDAQQVGTLHRGTELSLSPLQLNHSGHYRCRDLVVFWGWEQLASVAGPPELPEGSPLNLSCLSTPSPLRPPAPLLYRFYRDGQLVGGPQGSPQLLVPAVGVSHSGNYSCQVRFEGGTMRKSSAWLGITVRSECGDGHGEPPQPSQVSRPCSTPCMWPCLPSSIPGFPSPSLVPAALIPPWMHLPLSDFPPLSTESPSHPTCASPVCVPAVPVANATITPGPLALQVRPGDPVTLRFLVQVGSSPVTFTWLHNGHQVARGPLLELGAIHVGHSGTYLCVATNQLGQEGHRVFRALSPELALEVTPQGTTGHLWNTGGVTRGSHVSLRSPDHR